MGEGGQAHLLSPLTLRPYVPRCSLKQEFLKISQHSQENIHVGRDSNTDVFSVNIAKFLRTVFYRTRLVAASERINGKHKRHDFWSIFIPTLYVMIFYHINKFINVFLNTSSHKKNITKGIFLFEIIYVN